MKSLTPIKLLAFTMGAAVSSQSASGDTTCIPTSTWAYQPTGVSSYQPASTSNVSTTVHSISTTSSTTTSSASSSSTCISALPANFSIYGGSDEYFFVDVSGSYGSAGTLYGAGVAGDPGTFFANSVCNQGSCDIEQLSVNYLCANCTQNATYGAYVSQEGECSPFIVLLQQNSAKESKI
jgi:hypothetical protein